MEQSPTILLVEDSPMHAARAKYVLERSHFRVLLASTGVQTLECLARERPALILSEILMPEMDGFELCRRVRSDERFKDVPVILFTSLVDAREILMGLACGANGFVAKPFESKALLARIESALCPKVHGTGEADLHLETEYEGDLYSIHTNPRRILDFLTMTYDVAVQRNAALQAASQKLAERDLRLRRLNEELEERVKQKTAAFIEENREHWKAAETLRKGNAILQAAGDVLAKIVLEADPRAWYEKLIEPLAQATQSRLGLIADVACAETAEPDSNGAAAARALSQEFLQFWPGESAPDPLCHVLQELCTEAVQTGQPVILNHAAADPRCRGLPEGCPRPHTFLALPLRSRGNLVGLMAVVDRPNGYDEELIDLLQPLLTACGSVIEARQNIRKRDAAEKRAK